MSTDGQRARLAEHRRRLLDERLDQIADDAPRLEPLDELGGGGDSDVRRDQRLLEPLPGLVVGGIERRGRELAGQRAAALAERVAQLPEEAGLGLLFLDTLFVAEQGAPGRHRGEATRLRLRAGGGARRSATRRRRPS